VVGELINLWWGSREPSPVLASILILRLTSARVLIIKRNANNKFAFNMKIVVSSCIPYIKTQFYSIHLLQNAILQEYLLVSI
jgi:hypothetical protein